MGHIQLYTPHIPSFACVLFIRKAFKQTAVPEFNQSPQGCSPFTFGSLQFRSCEAGPPFSSISQRLCFTEVGHTKAIFRKRNKNNTTYISVKDQVLLGQTGLAAIGLLSALRPVGVHRSAVQVRHRADDRRERPPVAPVEVQWNHYGFMMFNGTNGTKVLCFFPSNGTNGTLHKPPVVFVLGHWFYEG